jgi:alkylation response protein AidB-like acyl-CoA dehydrogenase
MRFAFSDDQLAFRDAVRDLLERECPPEVVRAAWTNETGRTDHVWKHLADMGVLGLVAPESSGGLGLTMLDLVLVLEETGRAALPEPIVEHLAVALPLLPPDVQTAAAAGSITVAAGLTGDPFVPYAESADLLVLQHDVALYAVAGNDVQLTPDASIDGSRRLSAVQWDPSADTLVASEDALADALERGALGVAAQLVGLADRMIEMTVEYARHREQFGAPIGSFQAVKHHLANARVKLEFARPLVYRAAHSIAHDYPDRAIHVSMAKAQSSDAAALAARVALQCHGAIGYSYEYDLHLFMKRAWALAAAWGDARWHRARVGRAIL